MAEEVDRLPLKPALPLLVRRKDRLRRSPKAAVVEKDDVVIQ
jgi:hypothetical protein